MPLALRPPFPQPTYLIIKLFPKNMSSHFLSPSSLTTSMPAHTPLPSLTLITATTPSLGLGYFGSLPWQPLKSDLTFFARVTKHPPPSPPPPPPQSPPRPRMNDDDQNDLGQPTPTATINALLMGRKTWASIPAERLPLSGRVNVIITRQPAAITAELERIGMGKYIGAHGNQHVLVVGSIEEGLRRLVQEYPPPSQPPHYRQSKSGVGEGARGGDGEVSREAVIKGNREEQDGFSGKEQRLSLGRVFVMGGAEIYTQTLELDNCERVLWTQVEREWECDVWFPSGVLVDHVEKGEDTNEKMGGEGDRKRGGWTRRSDEELNAWCGESVAGEKTEESGGHSNRWRVQMWERKRASIGDGKS